MCVACQNQRSIWFWLELLVLLVQAKRTEKNAIIQGHNALSKLVYSSTMLFFFFFFEKDLFFVFLFLQVSCNTFWQINLVAF